MKHLMTVLALCALAPWLAARAETPAVAEGAPAAAQPAAEVPKISTEDLKAKLQAKEAKLVDVRTHGKGLEVRRIAGPTTKLSPKARQATVEKKFPDKKELVVIYDADETSPKPSELADRMQQMGYTNVKVYAPGFAGWLAAGQAVEDKTPPMGKGEKGGAPTEN